MAIVKMKKLRVMAMAADQERLLHQLQHLGCVEISQPSEELEDTKWASMIEPQGIPAGADPGGDVRSPERPGRCEGVRSQEEGRALPAPPSGDGGGAAAARYPAGRPPGGGPHPHLAGHPGPDGRGREPSSGQKERPDPLAGPEHAHGTAGECPCGLPSLRVPLGGGPGGPADPALRPGAPGGAH